jgi:hypothetical protein
MPLVATIARQPAAADAASAPVLELLAWVAERPRSYEEAMEAWQSRCPRATPWEDALIDGLIELERSGGAGVGRSPVVLTARGRALLAAVR